VSTPPESSRRKHNRRTTRARGIPAQQVLSSPSKADLRTLPELIRESKKALELLGPQAGFKERLYALGLSPKECRGRDWAEVCFDGHDLMGCDFSEANLTDATFVQSRIEDASFSDAAISFAALSRAVDFPLAFSNGKQMQVWAFDLKATSFLMSEERLEAPTIDLRVLREAMQSWLELYFPLGVILSVAQDLSLDSSRSLLDAVGVLQSSPSGPLTSSEGAAARIVGRNVEVVSIDLASKCLTLKVIGEPDLELTVHVNGVARGGCIWADRNLVFASPLADYRSRRS
jgi:hypothetical protein